MTTTAAPTSRTAAAHGHARATSPDPHDRRPVGLSTDAAMTQIDRSAPGTARASLSQANNDLSTDIRGD